MHLARLLPISLLPMTSFAVPVALSLSIVLDGTSTADSDHHFPGLEAFHRGDHNQFEPEGTISLEEYLGYLSYYGGNLTVADKALKGLKWPDDNDDNDTWEKFDQRSGIALEGIHNATSAIDNVIYKMQDHPFDGKFNKADTKSITEALGNTFSKVNETLIDPITTAVKAEIFRARLEGRLLQQFGGSLFELASRTVRRCHFDNNQSNDPNKDSDLDKATWRNINTVLDAMHSVKAAGDTLYRSGAVRAKHRKPVNQWKLQL